MSTKYSAHFNAIKTPQTMPIPGREKDMKENSAGGFGFSVDDWKRLERFLILGNEGGTYYASERALTIENAQCVQRCMAADGKRTVETIAAISESGRAPKNDPSLFALSMCAGLGDEATKKAAYAALNRVARIGTHIFQFAEYSKAFSKWGRAKRNGVANWYLAKKPENLAYQLVKYRNREGWAHGDLLRLSHPRTTGSMDFAFGWTTGKIKFENGKWMRQKTVGTSEEKNIKWESGAEVTLPSDLRILEGFEKIQLAKTAAEARKIIPEYKLPWETVPTELLGLAEVWEVLLPDLPMNALVRNLGRMSANGLLTQGSDAARIVVSKLSDKEIVKKSRLHPISALSALRVYSQGHGARGSLEWTAVPRVIDALDDLFYVTFGNIEPTGKRICLALDISGSMSSGDIAGVPGLTPRDASSAMAMVTARVEKDYEIMAFCDEFVPLTITPKMRIDEVVKYTEALPMGGTDCSLPMRWALGEVGAGKIADSRRRSGFWGSGRNIETPGDGKLKKFDAFVAYTDSETYAGPEHVAQALTRYRNTSKINAKLVVVGLTATEFTIGDPNDPGTLNVVGFDGSAPSLISDFIKE